MQTPVLFLVFNRPDVTKQVFETIRRARPPRLYVAADGARVDRSGEREQCAEVRKIASAVDWPCEVKTLFRDGNLGCKRAVTEGINWFFENEQEGIILEDDVAPSAEFFKFMERCLGMFHDDMSIGVVSGFNPIPGFTQKNKPFISRYPYIWGWATWRRVWNLYKVDIDLHPDEVFKLFYSSLRHKRGSKALSMVSEGIRQGNIDTWDLQLAITLLRNGLDTIYPPKSLIQNIGFGSDATHTVNADDRANIVADSSDTLSFERGEIRRLDKFDLARFNIEYPGLRKRILNKLSQLL